MSEKGSKDGLAALKEKRAVISGQITELRDRLVTLQNDLRHVDATIHIFDTTIDVEALPQRRPKKRIQLFRQGELSRLILDALRTADGPMRTYDLVSAIMLAKGHGEETRAALAPRVRTNLQYLQCRAKSVAKIGGGRSARWALA